MHSFNGERAEASGLMLLPRRWETDSIPLTGQDGQSIINEQLVGDADIVIGIFHAKLGRETPRAASGTAEELQRSSDAGKSVHIYFGSMPIPADHDREQLRRLDAFKAELQGRALFATFESRHHLQQKIRAAIEFDLSKFATATSQSPRPSAPPVRLKADFHAERDAYMSGDGTQSWRLRNARIELVNEGSGLANNLELAVLPPLDLNDEQPDLYNEKSVKLAPGESAVFRLLPMMREPQVVRARVTWQNAGREHAEDFELSLQD